MKIKVCGLRDPRNIAALARLRPDYMGFVFYAPSPRYADELPPEALDGLSAEICRTGVFVDATEETIRATARRYGLGAIQLHGAEPPALCRKLGKEYTVIKAFGIGDRNDLERTDAYEGTCDYYLFDTRTAARGGSGRKFDHTLLQSYRGDTPYLLSGGLGPEDAPVLARSGDPRCAGLDLNSRFETSPGIKDILQVERFMKTIKNHLQ